MIMFNGETLGVHFDGYNFTPISHLSPLQTLSSCEGDFQNFPAIILKRSEDSICLRLAERW